MNQPALVATIKAELAEPVREVSMRYPTNRSAIMPALDLAQEKYGVVDEDTYLAIAELLDVPEIWVFEVASFYTMFNRSEVGTYHIQICTNVSCMLRGAYAVLDHLRERLTLEPGETSGDGLFTLSVVECIGACDVAPALMVNETYHDNLTIGKIDELLASLQTVEMSGAS